MSGGGALEPGDDGLCFDHEAALEHLASADPMLASLIERAGPFTMRPDPAIEPYDYLVRSIIFQQLNGTAATTIHRRLLELLEVEEGMAPRPEQLLAADADHLRTAGVSRGKSAALHDLAQHHIAGEIPSMAQARDLDDEELVRRLTVVRGVGPWTVHMLLMFRLGRPDVLPVGDFGVREGYRIERGLGAQPTPRELTAAALAWRPYRSVASWYMWRAVDLARAGG